MNVTDFTNDQKQALLDLLIIGMYADHNLSSTEDTRIEKLLKAFGLTSENERQNFSDAAFTRVRRQTDSLEAIRKYVGGIASKFPTSKDREKAYTLLDDLLTSDSKLTPEESKLLTVIKEVFQL